MSAISRSASPIDRMTTYVMFSRPLTSGWYPNARSVPPIAILRQEVGADEDFNERHHPLRERWRVMAEG